MRSTLAHTRAATPLTLALLALASVAPAQERLTLQRIFASGEFAPKSLSYTWLPDGARVAIQQENEQTNADDIWAEELETGRRTKLIDGSTLVPEGESRRIDIEEVHWSADGSKALLYTRSIRVWRQNTKGFYYVYDLATRKLTALSKAEGYQQFAKFSPDGRQVGFVRNNDIFVVDLASGTERRITKDGSENIINGTFDWVYEEELDLRDGWRWSPDGTRIAFWRLDQSPIKTFHMINDIPLYPQLVPVRYPKAGEANSKVQVGVVTLANEQVTWIDLGSDPEAYIARMDWAESSTEIVLQRLNRHQNRLEVLLADATTGKSRVLLADTDSAWVDVDNDLVWARRGRQFLWSSERDGYNHIYLYNRDGSLARQLTRGGFDVLGIDGVNEREGWVYYTAALPLPRERQLYRVRLSGGAPQKLSQEPGAHRQDVSPDGRYYISVYSDSDSPPRTRLHRAGGQPLRTLVENSALEQKARQLGWRGREFFTFKTADGVELNGWMVRPANFDASKKYPVLMEVYGGPGSQTVTDTWSGPSALWHTLLGEKGYIIASVDNRGTGARGRAFKKLSYLNLGKWEADDQIEAAKYFASLPFVDGARIGIWGWSYGGYMTALTMGRGGNVFRAGISVAPVTDWKLYDTIYTERFMRTPQENPDGYRESAPLRHVNGLTGKLLLVHGTGDDNVHFQNTVQLVNELERAGKQFQLMFYPNRTHSIAGGNTRLHLYTMMTEFIEKNL